MINVGITGINGFIGSNLNAFLKKKMGVKTFYYNGPPNPNVDCDVVVHLAGVNRGLHDKMMDCNVRYTLNIADWCYHNNKKMIFAGSVYNKKNSYSLTKGIGEDIVNRYYNDLRCDFTTLKLPNIIGERCKPFYNSFVTTMAYMHAKKDFSYKEKMVDSDVEFALLWVDDLCQEIYELAVSPEDPSRWGCWNSFYFPQNSFYTTLNGIQDYLEGKGEDKKIQKKFNKLLKYYKSYEVEN